MAGDWIKFEKATLTKPEVLRIARITGLDRFAVVGRLLEFWAWIDANCVDGTVDGTVDGDVDALVDAVSFAQALETVGWIVIHRDVDKIEIVNFDRHLSKGSKNRALKTERQRNWRRQSVDASTSTTELPQKRREDITPQTPQGARRANRAKGENNRNGAAVAQVKNAKGPEQLSAILRRLGLGDGPEGKSWQETQAWAVKQCEVKNGTVS